MPGEGWGKARDDARALGRRVPSAQQPFGTANVASLRHCARCGACTVDQVLHFQLLGPHWEGLGMALGSGLQTLGIAAAPRPAQTIALALLLGCLRVFAEMRRLRPVKSCIGTACARGSGAVGRGGGGQRACSCIHRAQSPPPPGLGTIESAWQRHQTASKGSRTAPSRVALSRPHTRVRGSPSRRTPLLPVVAGTTERREPEVPLSASHQKCWTMPKRCVACAGGAQSRCA